MGKDPKKIKLDQYYSGIINHQYQPKAQPANQGIKPNNVKKGRRIKSMEPKKYQEFPNPKDLLDS